MLAMEMNERHLFSLHSMEAKKFWGIIVFASQQPHFSSHEMTLMYILLFLLVSFVTTFTGKQQFTKFL